MGCISPRERRSDLLVEPFVAVHGPELPAMTRRECEGGQTVADVVLEPLREGRPRRGPLRSVQVFRSILALDCRLRAVLIKNCDHVRPHCPFDRLKLKDLGIDST